MPVYKLNLTDGEVDVIQYSLKNLKNHDTYFVAPSGLLLSWYKKFWPKAKFLTCPDVYFTSPQAYSQLMLGAGFYQYFASYSHMLVLQTDAVVLADRLEEWMQSPYDYVGAPWPKPYSITLKDTGNGFNNQTFTIAVGNGGFSLRRINACIRAINDYRWILEKNPMDEDLFFALVGQLSSDFLVPNPIVAAKFSLEINPRAYVAMTGQVPMGGHAWAKWDPGFWQEQFEAVGLVVEEVKKVDRTDEENRLFKLGIESQNKGDLHVAERLFKEVLAFNPESWKCLYSMAVIEKLNGNNTLALNYLDNSLLADPKSETSYFAKGKILQDLKRYAESIECYDKSLALKSDMTDALSNKAAILYELGKLDDALNVYDKLLSRFPNHGVSLRNKGIILNDLSLKVDAVACFQKLKKVEPSHKYIEGILARARVDVCDWTEFAKAQKKMQDGVRKNSFVCNPLCFNLFSDSAQEHLLCADIFGEDFFPAASLPLWQGDKYNHKKIRIAYISPDFREHPVAHLISGVLAFHDRDKFEIVGISLGYDDKSPMREKIMACCDQFVDVRGTDSESIAKLIRSLETDIAIDLAGYTQGSRVDVFARKPAPIQISFLGYPGTMGNSYHDYILADRFVIPPEQESNYSEKVLRLPHAYLPCDDSLRMADPGVTRESQGLPEDAFVFCCFNHEFKINPDMFEVWIQVLKKVPGSVLWLMKLNEPSRVNLLKETTRRGVDPSRLVFAERTPKLEDHLSRYRLADLFIDTFPYNAHSTASDVLRCGLPLVTRQGSSFSSRVASSLLLNLGLPELVTHSLAQYQSTILRYAQDPEQLKLLREKLNGLKGSAIFDTRLFCADLEATYQKVYQDSHSSDADASILPGQN